MSKSIINVNRFQNKVRGIFGLRGDNPIPTLDDLVPGVIVENDRPEFAFPGGELLWQTWQDRAAGGAGIFSTTEITNPAGSGIIVVVEAVLANVGSIDLRIMEAGQIAGSIEAPRQIGPRDTRIGKLGVTSGVFGTRVLFNNTAALAGVTIGRVNVNVPWYVPIVISAGWALLIHDTTNNAAYECTIVGRERPQERGLPS